MNLESLANLGEVVSAIAVVASLLYLAVQVRQATRAQRTENYGRALDRISAMQAMLSHDGETSRIFAIGVEDTTRLTPLDRIRYTWALYEAFGAFEFMYHTWRTNEIPEEVWRRWSYTVAWWLSFPGVRAWWHNRPVRFSDSFTSYVETVIRDNPVDPEAGRRWRAFVETGDAAGEAGPTPG